MARAKQARNGRGSLVLFRGKWRHYFYDSAGEHRSRTIGSKREYPTKAHCWRAIENNNHPAPAADAGPTLRAVIKGYLKERAPKRQSSRRGICSRLRTHILPKWGGAGLMKNVQPRPVQLWLDNLKISPRTRGHILDILRDLWSYAQFAGWLSPTENPMRLVRIIGRSKRQRRPHSLTIEEYRKFLDQIKVPIIRMIAIVCGCFGLRISEALGLRWHDLDAEHRLLHIKRAVVKQVEDELKTENSRRPMPLDQELLTVLLEWKRKSQFTEDNDWIFASPWELGRQPVSYTYILKTFRRAATAAGIPCFGTHSLRHSYRSWLDSLGVPIAVQQKLMRHSDIRTTMNVYGDVITQQESEALSQISALTFGKQHTTAHRLN